MDKNGEEQSKHDQPFWKAVVAGGIGGVGLTLGGHPLETV